MSQHTVLRWASLLLCSLILVVGCRESPSAWRAIPSAPVADPGLAASAAPAETVPQAPSQDEMLTPPVDDTPATTGAESPAPNVEPSNASGATSTEAPASGDLTDTSSSAPGEPTPSPRAPDAGTSPPTGGIEPDTIAIEQGAIPTVPVSFESPGHDIFGELRSVENPAGYEDDWLALDAALRQIQTLEGAHFDRENERLILYGQLADEQGPFRLEDFVVALQAEYHKIEALGVTIDPIAADPTGPKMEVKYFGGAENTNFGRVMFEADRLLKCLGLGKDNMSGERISSSVDGYAPLTTVGMALKEGAKKSPWSRFWIATSQEDVPDDDAKGKPIVAVADTGNTIWFERTPMFVRTEIMIEAGDGKLASSGGQQSKASAYFADLVTHKYDEFAAEFPVLAELQEMSKLLLVAHWIRERQLPIDYELLYLRSSADVVDTPKETPTITVSTSITSDGVKSTMSMYGGVKMRTRPFFAQDAKGSTDQLSAIIAGRPAGEQAAVVSRVRPAGESSKQVVGIARRPRGPPPNVPGSPTTASSSIQPKRRALRFRESSGTIQAGSQPSNAALRANLSVRPTDVAQEAATLEGFDLPVFTHPVTNQQLLNLPVLRLGYHPAHIRTLEITLNGQQFQQRVPDYVYVTSPLRDIDIRFKAKPEFNDQQTEFYFTTDHPAVVGYFPASNEVVLRDSTRIKFSPETGLVAEVEGGGKPSLLFAHRTYIDGPLMEKQELAYAQQARPPPGTEAPRPQRRSVVVRESHGTMAASSRDNAVQLKLSKELFEPPRVAVRNRGSGMTIQVRQQAGQLAFLESGLGASVAKP